MALNAIIALCAVVLVLGIMLGRLSVPDKSMYWYGKGSTDAAQIASEYTGRYREIADALEKELTVAKLKADNEFRRGWEESKQLYYIDLREDRRAEEERIRKEFDEENRDFCPINSELLMAYGVTRVGDLPKNVRDAYSIPASLNQLDLDTMVRNETGGVSDE